MQVVFVFLNKTTWSTHMAVITLFMSDRDKNKTFTDKKSADNYDKTLELAENVAVWLEKSIKGLSEEQTESIGMMIAENKELLVKAIKGKSEILVEDEQAVVAIGSEKTEVKNEKVTKISA